MTDTEPLEVRYPRSFELYRLEALGDPPYLDDDEARALYEAGRALRVVPGEESGHGKPAWYLFVSPEGFRFSVTFYAETGTPVREAVWERDGDGLFCREVVDLFYPAGDPRAKVPYRTVTSVTQRFAPDGVARVALSSPAAPRDAEREAEGLPTARLRCAVPAFGDWAEVVERSGPPALERFGPEAAGTALAFAAAAPGPPVPAAAPRRSGGWHVPATARDIMSVLDALVTGGAPSLDIPVLARGDARILPLAVQDPDARARHPREERRRMAALASDIEGACEHREGRGIAVDLSYEERDSVGSYVAALGESGATRAVFWAYGAEHGVVLVWTGAEATGDLAIALHVVPARWVSQRRATAAVTGIDVSWSGVDAAAAADSLAGEQREERGRWRAHSGTST